MAMKCAAALLIALLSAAAHAEHRFGHDDALDPWSRESAELERLHLERMRHDQEVIRQMDANRLWHDDALDPWSRESIELEPLRRDQEIIRRTDAHRPRHDYALDPWSRESIERQRLHLERMRHDQEVIRHMEANRPWSRTGGNNCPKSRNAVYC